MKYFVFLCIVAVSVSWAIQTSFDYPVAWRDEDYFYEMHGEKMKDPYHWLEKNTTQTRDFMDAQNKFTLSFLEKGNLRSKIIEKLKNIEELDTEPKSCEWIQREKNYFLFHKATLKKKTDLTKEKADVVLPPDDSIGIIGGSRDGNWIAYGTCTPGSEWFTIKVRNVETLKDNPGEELRFVRLSRVCWTREHKGFFYTGYSENAFKTNKLENNTLFYHRISQTQDKDVPVFTHPNLFWRIALDISHDGKFLILHFAHDSKKTALFIGELPADDEIKGKIKFKPIVSSLLWKQSYVGNNGPNFILLTDQHASKRRLVSFNFNTFDENQKFTDFIAEDPGKYLSLAECFHENKLVLYYEGKDTLDIHWLSNATYISSIKIGDQILRRVQSKYSSPTILYHVGRDVISPEIVYKYNILKPNEESIIIREMKWSGFNESEYILEKKVFYSSYSAKVPIYIIKKKNMVGPKPCLLHGYGGFGLNNERELNPYYIYFLNEFDGIVALPHIRGEFSWHDEGRKLNKQNCFDDFQLAARFLVEIGYTEPKLTVIDGASHGGLLVATCVHQAPEFYGAAIADRGIMDMLRYHIYNSDIIEEFGNPENKTEYDVIRRYSPLHRIEKATKDHQYPPILILAAELDERTEPFHSMKFAAELQYGNPFQTNPTLLQVYKGVGHGHDKTPDQRTKEYTDKLLFIHKVLNLEKGDKKN